jgi:hypothetical protein
VLYAASLRVVIRCKTQKAANKLRDIVNKPAGIKYPAGFFVPLQKDIMLNFKKNFLLLLLTVGVHSAIAQNAIRLQDGDLIFQNLECGPLCDAINAVTQGYQNKKFSHMGMVQLRNDSVLVIEAAGKDVHRTPIKSFLAKSSQPHYVGRLKPAYQQLVPAAIAFSDKQMGRAYDDQYLYNNSKYYCSELIYDAFKAANQNTPFFQLLPMTYKEPGSGQFFPGWAAYFKQRNMEVPEGKPGCNPGGISLSEKIEILGTLQAGNL